MRRGVFLFAVFSLAFLLPGCGGGSSSTAQLRFVQGSPDAPLVDFVVDGKTQASGLSFGNATDYVSVNAGSRHVQIIPSNSNSPVLDEKVSLNDSDHRTIVLTGQVAQSKALLLTDGGTTAVTGDGQVRVLNISISLGQVDVFEIVSGGSIAGITPTATNLAFDQDTGYQAVPAGDYQVVVTAPGTTNAYLTTGPLNLTASQNQTIVIRDSGQGGFTFSLLKDQ